MHRLTPPGICTPAPCRVRLGRPDIGRPDSPAAACGGPARLAAAGSLARYLCCSTFRACSLPNSVTPRSRKPLRRDLWRDSSASKDIAPPIRRERIGTVKDRPEGRRPWMAGVKGAKSSNPGGGALASGFASSASPAMLAFPGFASRFAGAMELRHSGIQHISAAVPALSPQGTVPPT
jgi:hypothetical protein